MVYRIALTGAQGTGKSTLARAIAARLERDGVGGFQLIAGLGDQAARAGLRAGMHAGAEVVRAFVRLHCDREAAATGALQIYDRCLLDALAYADVLDCLPSTELRTLRAAAVASCQRCAELIWLRVTEDYPVSGPQDETPDFRRAIDAAIGSLARACALTIREHALVPGGGEAIAAEVVGRWRAAS